VFNLGIGEITVILLLALIFLGPSKLPEMASGLGRLIKEIRKATSDVKNEIALDDTFRKPFEELRDAVTLHPEELKRRDRIKHELEEAQRRSSEEQSTTQSATQSATPATTQAARDGAAIGAAPGENTGDGDGTGSGTGTPPLEPTTLPATPIAKAVEAAALPATALEARALPATSTESVPGPGPASPPAGTVARRGAPPLPGGRLPYVVPPTSSADRSNTTQLLSEGDLLPGGPPKPPGPPALPPPSPIRAGTPPLGEPRKPLPPPPPPPKKT
jgi:sec-independent protein translocase protein TatB